MYFVKLGLNSIKFATFTGSNLYFSELENHLKTLSYPINPNSVNVATNLKAAKSNQGDKHESETTNKEKCERMFKKLASQLLKIESPDFKRSYLRNNSNDVSLTDKNPEDEDDYGYGVKNNALINILIQPLEKRFKFHFFTNRKTNNLDKVGFRFVLNYKEFCKKSDLNSF